MIVRSAFSDILCVLAELDFIILCDMYKNLSCIIQSNSNILPTIDSNL